MEAAQSALYLVTTVVGALVIIVSALYIVRNVARRDGTDFPPSRAGFDFRVLAFAVVLFVMIQLIFFALDLGPAWGA